VYLQEPDWAGNIELADRVNHDHYRTTVAKDASKALRIKLLSRQPREQFLALSALECLMKNCGPDYHEMMLSKGVLETCMELGSNTTTHAIVRDKVLHLIREWSEHLNAREFKGVYRDLVRYGVRFPERDEFVHPGGGRATSNNSSGTMGNSNSIKYDDVSNVDVTGEGTMMRMNGGEPLHYPAPKPGEAALGIPRHSQSIPVKQVLKYDATMSEEDRRAIEMTLREEEEAMGGGGGVAYDGGRDGVLGMTRAQRNQLPGGGHWSSKRYQRSIGNPNKYKLDAIGRKPEGLMPVEGMFVNRTISLTKAREHPDKIRARERKARDIVESAKSILGVFEEILNASDKDVDLCEDLAKQAKESSSSIVSLLTEGDGDLDEALTSKLIELSEKLNVAMYKYERMGRGNAPQTSPSSSSSAAATLTKEPQQALHHDLIGLSSGGFNETMSSSPNPFVTTSSGGFNETMSSSPNPFVTTAPSRAPSFPHAAKQSNTAFDDFFGNSFSPQSPPQQPSGPVSLREQYMLKQQQQQNASRESPSNSELSSEFLTPASQLNKSSFGSPPSSKALNGTATPLGFEAKRDKERQEATLNDPFASLAINAGLTPKKGVVKSASSSPTTSSSGQTRVAHNEMGTPPQRTSTLQRSPTNPFDNDFKYPKI